MEQPLKKLSKAFSLKKKSHTGKSFSPVMNKKPVLSDRRIRSMRGSKNIVDPHLPYGWLVEKELTDSGKIEDTGIIFLTNMECPFHCLMCDLWKNTTDEPVETGDIPGQIKWALSKMPGIKHLKLYNSGSFFDKRAIPEKDYGEIASLLSAMETVIVESHPRFLDKSCLEFRDLLRPKLNVAMGLETVQPGGLEKLNKKMTLEEFDNAAAFLKEHGIGTRAFILLRPPFLTGAEGIYWAERSVDYAFNAGIECCTIIPVRPGNGAMDFLEETGDFRPPDIKSLEKVLEYGIGLKAGRVFADTWDLQLFSDCEKCTEERTARINEMNLTQRVSSPVNCYCDK
jgi:archaeosine synthase beta-subunit